MLVVIGNSMIAIGAGDFKSMVAGRFVFGLGGESLIVAQTTVLVRKIFHLFYSQFLD